MAVHYDSTNIGSCKDFSIQEEDTKLRPAEHLQKAILLVPESHWWRYTTIFQSTGFQAHPDLQNQKSLGLHFGHMNF